MTSSKFSLPYPMHRIVIPLIFIIVVIFVFYKYETARPSDSIANTELVKPNHLSVTPEPIEVDPLDEIRPQLKALTQQQIALKNQLGKHNAALEEVKLQVVNLHEEMSEATKQMQAQRHRLLEHIEQKKPRIVKRRRLRQKTPQWVLASIDQWGNDYTAVLNHQQQLVTLRQGDHYQDWQLTQIDPLNHQIELVNARHKHLTLRVNQ